MTNEEFQALVLGKLTSLESSLAQTNLYEAIQQLNVRVERTENKLDVLNTRLFTQEAEIQGLKRIK